MLPLIRERGSTGAAGHFHLEKATAERYGLRVSKENGQRFDIDRASSAAARYLKDLDTTFRRKTTVLKKEGLHSIPVKSVSERKKFVLGAYNAGEGRVSRAQRLAGQAGKNPRLRNDVRGFLAEAGARDSKETKEYVEKVLGYDETDPVNGRGWAVLDGDAITGRIFFHAGDDSAFTARRAGDSVKEMSRKPAR